MEIDEMRLDGNAVAGALTEIFALEMTEAIATCAVCGAVGPIASLFQYARSMGVVLRCARCYAPMLRAVLTPDWIRLDASGIALLTVPLQRLDPG